MKKTVFISSTYDDLKDSRRAIWQLLEDFDISVRGMEKFGARPDSPLKTCLAEVEQSDVLLCLVAFRAGSIDTDSGKSYTQLEYEHALDLGKDVLIYLVDEAQAKVRYSDIDIDQTNQAKLNAFKSILKERHTIETFVEPEDLVEKLRRDLGRYFVSKTPESDKATSELEVTSRLVSRFLLMPKAVVGRETLFVVKFEARPYPASRDLCKAFNLDYGRTIGVSISVREPHLENSVIVPFRQLYATGTKADRLIELASAKEPIRLYARLQFAEEDVLAVKATFFGFWDEQQFEYAGDQDWVSAEGQAILLFSKAP